MKKLILASLFALNLGLWSDLVSNKAWALDMVTGTVMPAITVDSLTVTNSASVGGALTAVGPFTVSPGSMTVRPGANQVFGVYSVGGILRTGALNDAQSANVAWYVDGNPLALNTGGGSVGIGIASPATLVHAKGSGATVRIEDSATVAAGNAVGVQFKTATAADRAKGAIFFVNTGGDGDGRGNIRFAINNTADSTNVTTAQGIVDIPAGGVTTGGALCLNASKVLSKCTSAVDASGNCTCP